MNKRDLLLNLLDSSRQPETVPAAFFTHFEPDCHAGQAAVDKHLEFFRFTGMDFVKIQFEQPFPRLREIQKPADWAAKLPFFKLDHYAGMLGVVEGLVKAAKKEALIILTLYSPFMLTNTIAGAETVAGHIAEDPAAYQVGIGRMAESLLGFVCECIRLGVDGFYTSTQGGELGRLASPELFDECVRPYDLLLMDEINRACSLNILHVCDFHLPYQSLERFKDYPGQVVNTSLELAGGGHTTPYEVAELFNRPFMGGLERKGVLSCGAPEQIRQAVCFALQQAPERTILGADCTVPPGTPWENLRLAVQAAHEFGASDVMC